MRKLDRKGASKFIDIVSDTRDCPIDRDQLLTRFHAEKSGQLLSGAAVFAAMRRAVPLLGPFGLAARLRWGLAGLERAHVWFWPHWLQRLVTWLERRVA